LRTLSASGIQASSCWMRVASERRGELGRLLPAESAHALPEPGRFLRVEARRRGEQEANVVGL
jgi:hypothetical protein